MKRRQYLRAASGAAALTTSLGTASARSAVLSQGATGEESVIVAAFTVLGSGDPSQVRECNVDSEEDYWTWEFPEDGVTLTKNGEQVDVTPPGSFELPYYSYEGRCPVVWSKGVAAEISRTFDEAFGDDPREYGDPTKSWEEQNDDVGETGESKTEGRFVYKRDPT